MSFTAIVFQRADQYKQCERERSCRTSSQTKAFFFAVNPSGGVTVFKAGIGECSLDGLVSNLERIMYSTKTDAQYDVALAAFSDHPDPVGPMLHWV
ncbi:protein of unknown function (plasmid) [Cupriavidus taiwanensis]|uniref:Uncharacterized protein n=1 Tax=Cupriavidus taiwanensis TaxID=164546 RepID=A0A375FH12_9BURK|nr:hypothetical protein [Cupriavidus taiwanensis]SOZ70907.1 protein of unknown function [Cupriavidus taiwanensis]SOZ72101.1 protein of unknown function [Cupriavidus taiwanensis]SOZ74401.1 protein of unknown function [Cupriavidus taiwanensis]SPA03306.1 protein of unknown function [Cupriavidus taiwanensis]SPA11282.1 protein of unknown function [Cupriavidus taiwanensis]